MSLFYHLLFLTVFSSSTFVRAELPPEIKPTAENYDRAMKQYDANVEAIVKIDRDAYRAVLTAARKREEGAKRGDAVAAIDVEMQALRAGQRSEEAPPQLPAELFTATGSQDRTAR